MGKTIKIGIMPMRDFANRTIAIVKGEYKVKPDDPKIWFESLQSLAQVLSGHNQELLKLIIRAEPESLTDLETISGRSTSNLSRTLKTMERYGIVELKKEGRTLRPVVKATGFDIRIDINAAA